MKWILLALVVLFLVCAFLFGLLTYITRSLPSNDLPVPERTKIEFPYQQSEKIAYEATFKGLRVGTFEFEYKGRNNDLDLIVVTNKVNIFNIFQIDSTESVYIDAYTCLPKRVERKVVFFGRPEKIIEEYNQKEGWVNVTQEKGGKTKNTVIPQKPPIHNVHSLFFAYPLELKDKVGLELDFNLPLEKVKMRVKELRKDESAQGLRESYVCEISPKRIVLELDKDKRYPLHIEMPALWGKLEISKLDEQSLCK